MTVCIAAICEKGDAIVSAADRFRWHPTAAIEAELEERKFYFLTEQIALMGAGNSNDVEDVMRRVRAMANVPSQSVVEVSQQFVAACQSSRLSQAENLYSKRSIGLKAEDLRAAMTSAIPGSIAVELYNKLQSHNFGSSLIVAGIDHEGGVPLPSKNRSSRIASRLPAL